MLMPVRFPFDCARSNLENGHVNLFPGLYTESPVLEVVAAILEQVRWFAAIARRHPDRCLIVFEHEFGLESLKTMAVHVGIHATSSWLAEAAKLFRPRPSEVTITAQNADDYRQLVEAAAGLDSQLAADLLAFDALRPICA